MEQTFSSTQVLNITQPATQAVKDLLEERQLENMALRIFVSAGGCSGVQYGMAFEKNILETDTVINHDGLTFVIDDMSINYMNGAIVDFVDGPQGKGFLINNPSSVSSCAPTGGSCGSNGGSCGCD